MKLFTKKIDKKLFEQYPIGSNLDKQVVVAKLFNPCGSGSWYLINSDPNDPDYIWAIVDLHCVEVGSVSREDLMSFRGPLNIGIERDFSFKPINATLLLKKITK